MLETFVRTKVSDSDLGVSGNFPFLMNPYGSALTRVWDHLSLVGKERWKESRVKNLRFLTISWALLDRPRLITTNSANDHVHGWLRVSNRTEHFPVCPPYNRFRKSNLPSMLHDNKPFPASVVQAGKGFGSLRESP